MGLKVIAIASIAVISSAAVADTYTIDAKHSFPIFEVGHYGFSLQRGQFTKLTGTLDPDPNSLRSNEVVVLTPDGTVESRLQLPDMPWGIVTYPKSLGSLDAPYEPSGPEFVIRNYWEGPRVGCVERVG